VADINAEPTGNYHEKSEKYFKDNNKFIFVIHHNILLFNKLATRSGN
jgi:hypothetical protein